MQRNACVVATVVVPRRARTDVCDPQPGLLSNCERFEDDPLVLDKRDVSMQFYEPTGVSYCDLNIFQ